MSVDSPKAHNEELRKLIRHYSLLLEYTNIHLDQWRDWPKQGRKRRRKMLFEARNYAQVLKDAYTYELTGTTWGDPSAL